MWHISKALQDAASSDMQLPEVDEGATYFVSQIFEPSTRPYNYNSNPFMGTLFNEPLPPYGKDVKY